MDIFTIIFWVIGIVLITISFLKSKTKTFAAMKKTKKNDGEYDRRDHRNHFYHRAGAYIGPTRIDQNCIGFIQCRYCNGHCSARWEYHTDPRIRGIPARRFIRRCRRKHYPGSRVLNDAYDGRRRDVPA